MTERLSYTLKAASEATGIGRTTLLHAIHAKRLKAIRVGDRGGKWVIPAKSLEDWFDKQLEAQA